MAGDTAQNGRMTWREVNEILEKRDARLTERLERIESKLEPIPALCQRIARNERDIAENKEEIKTINRRSNLIDGINAALAIVGSAIGAVFGRAP